MAGCWGWTAECNIHRYDAASCKPACASQIERALCHEVMALTLLLSTGGATSNANWKFNVAALPNSQWPCQKLTSSDKRNLSFFIIFFVLGFSGREWETVNKWIFTEHVPPSICISLQPEWQYVVHHPRWFLKIIYLAICSLLHSLLPPAHHSSCLCTHGAANQPERFLCTAAKTN